MSNTALNIRQIFYKRLLDYWTHTVFFANSNVPEQGGRTIDTPYIRVFLRHNRSRLDGFATNHKEYSRAAVCIFELYVPINTSTEMADQHIEGIINLFEGRDIGRGIIIESVTPNEIGPYEELYWQYNVSVLFRYYYTR